MKFTDQKGGHDASYLKTFGGTQVQSSHERPCRNTRAVHKLAIRRSDSLYGSEIAGPNRICTLGSAYRPMAGKVWIPYYGSATDRRDRSEVRGAGPR